MSEQAAIKLQAGEVIEPARATPVVREVDVLVCGGGVSGVGAALGAARSGAKTMVIERNAFLGGAATAVIMNTWNVPLAKMTGVAKEIAQTLTARGAGVASGPTFPFDPEAFKDVAMDLMKAASVEILTYTWVVEPIMDGNKIRGVIIQNKSGRQAILAKTVVDCTGDADIAAAAGAEFVKGREKDEKMRPMSVLFRLGGVDIKRAVEYCKCDPKNFTADPNFHILDLETGLVRMSGFFDIVDKARANGELPDEIHYIRFEGISVDRGIVTVNNSRVYNVDGTNAWDLTRADMEARAQNRKLFTVIKNNIPGFENSYVMDSSPTVGVRETRRVRGPHLLQQDDMMALATYPDSVARIWRHMSAGRDWHKADGGEGAPNDAVYRTGTTSLTWFEIPLGALVPNRIEGMTIGGRALSATHDADMWSRAQYCCLVTGQVAGAAAALAAEHDISPSKLDIRLLQQRLAAAGIDVGDTAGVMEKALA